MTNICCKFSFTFILLYFVLISASLHAAEANPILVEEYSKLMDSRTKLFLTRQNLNSEAGIAIAEVLEHNRTLTLLALGSNIIGDSGTIALASALEKNDVLEILELYNNEISDQSANAIAEALEKNKTLKKLDLSNNLISNIGIARITDALTRNTTLEAFLLGKNRYDEAVTSNFLDMLKKNTKITLFFINIAHSTQYKLIKDEITKNKEISFFDNGELWKKACLLILGHFDTKSLTSSLPNDILSNIVNLMRFIRIQEITTADGVIG